MMSDADGLGVFNLCFYSSTRPCVSERNDFETAACASMTAGHVHIYIYIYNRVSASGDVALFSCCLVTQLVKSLLFQVR